MQSGAWRGASPPRPVALHVLRPTACTWQPHAPGVKHLGRRRAQMAISAEARSQRLPAANSSRATAAAAAPCSLPITATDSSASAASPVGSARCRGRPGQCEHIAARPASSAGPNPAAVRTHTPHSGLASRKLRGRTPPLRLTLGGLEHHEVPGVGAAVGGRPACGLQQQAQRAGVHAMARVHVLAEH